MALKREARSFLMPRDPSIDRRFRPCPQKRERLFNEIEEEDDYDEGSDSDSVEDEYYDTRSTGEALTESTDSSAAVETGALVYLRLKPVEMPSSAYSISVEGKVLITGPPTESSSTSKNKNSMEKHYSFSEIFDSEVSQREVYEKCIGEKILAEESFTVLTYGTSGSGKTFTLLGDDMKPGIIPRSLENIFTLYQANIHPNPLAKLVNSRTTFLDDHLVEKENLLRRQILDNCKNLETNYLQLQHSIRNDHHFETVPLDDVSVFIWVTFVEIYNELVYDLLAPIKSTGSFANTANTTRKNLKIVCNDGNVFIKGVTSIYIKSSVEALKLLRSGLQKLTYASTSINANSSRSHCVFFVDVLKYYRTGVYTETSYKFCDLAGSERLDKTGNMGSRLKEAQRINTSLMVLGRCLDAANNLASSGSTTSTLNKKERIPFRESKLTMILQAALQGKEKLAMIVNVTPVEKYYEENLNVLNFASIASNIIFKAPAIKPNQSRYSVFSATPDNGYIQQLLEENANLKADIEKLNNHIEQQNQHIDQQDQHIEAIIDESYHLKNEIERLTHEHAEELLKQEQELRNQLVDSFKTTLEEHKKQFELRMQREIENQKRIYESRIEFLKRRHQEELEDLREELEEGVEKNNSIENLDDDEVIEVEEKHNSMENFIENTASVKENAEIREKNIKNEMLEVKHIEDAKGEVLEDKENIQQN
ncbi:kinesin-like protein subito [Lucilia cuprina]|uniref:kinesin-like protein subito n=1 Tax=Lucilia cuprina TaxID=7375 RepID=UPI001F05E78A|nr:kinesin-like protein subito [Lucilia cuprina]